MQTSFAILAGCTGFFFINTFLLMPKRHIPWPLPPGWETKEKYATQDVDKPAVNRDEGEKENGFNEKDTVKGKEKKKIVYKFRFLLKAKFQRLSLQFFVCLYFHFVLFCSFFFTE